MTNREFLARWGHLWTWDHLEEKTVRDRSGNQDVSTVLIQQRGPVVVELVLTWRVHVRITCDVFAWLCEPSSPWTLTRQGDDQRHALWMWLGMQPWCEPLSCSVHAYDRDMATHERMPTLSEQIDKLIASCRHDANLAVRMSTTRGARGTP
ncbi:MAG TPA: hypothetical protein VF183_07400 [Acidimicrobiales bacterium]